MTDYSFGSPGPERKATCKRCLELAARHGLALPGTQGEKA